MQAAGDPPLTLAGRGHCIEVMTGTVLPAGCDSVVPVERITLCNGEAELEHGLAVEPDQNVHRRGTDTRQGNLLLATGARLGPPEIAIAAGAGMARIRGEHPADAGRHLDRKRANRARRAHPAASGPPLECLRHRRSAANARLPARGG